MQWTIAGQYSRQGLDIPRVDQVIDLAGGPRGCPHVECGRWGGSSTERVGAAAVGALVAAPPQGARCDVAHDPTLAGHHRRNRPMQPDRVLGAAPDPAEACGPCPSSPT